MEPGCEAWEKHATTVLSEVYQDLLKKDLQRLIRTVVAEEDMLTICKGVANAIPNAQNTLLDALEQGTLSTTTH